MLEHEMLPKIRPKLYFNLFIVLVIFDQTFFQYETIISPCFTFVV